MREFLSYFENGDVLKLADEIGAADVLLDVKRLFGKGEGLWLWDKATGEDEIRKLLTEYKIIAASNKINTKASSLSACLGEWRTKVQAIRIPCSTLSQEMPTLKGFLQILKEIITSGDLAYDKRATFLFELISSTDVFLDFLATKMDVFKNVYSYYLTGFSENEIGKLYASLPTTSFKMEKPEFENEISSRAKQMRQEQEKFRLHLFWEQKTSSKTPKEWSTKNRTPILSLVPANIQNDVRRVFDAINRTNPEDNDVKFSLDFLQTKGKFLADLSDTAKIYSVYLRDIVGRFSAILPDADEVRSRLEDVVPSDHYDWYANPTIVREVERFAQARYNQGGSDKVLERIEKMDDHKAKEYLKRLIKDNINVGIEIISEGES
jgi:hypothetical protein